MKTHTVTTYSFDELSETAKQHAIDANRERNVNDSYWHEHIIENTKEIGRLMGIEIDDMYFSGFASQGDGACFTGRYSYAKGAVKAVKDYAPQDDELHRIVRGLTTLQRRYFYGLSATVKHVGHYYHQYCTEIDVEHDNANIDILTSEELTELLRDFMRWIYRQLEAEYEYQTADEQIADSFRANETEFTEAGDIY
jgi:hypothetical protein